MIEFLYNWMPGVTNYPTFLVVEGIVTVLAIWWLMCGVTGEVHRYTRPKSYKINQFDYFRRR